MKIEDCSHEAEALEATRSGNWSEDLRRHAARCPACAEVILVATALFQEEAQPAGKPSLPSAGFVWWKAQLRVRRQAAERAAEPIAIVERLAWGYGLLALAGLGLWQRVRVERWWAWFTGLPYVSSLQLASLRFQELRPGQIFHDGAGFDPWSPTMVLLLGLCACLALVTFLLYLVLERE